MPTRVPPAPPPESPLPPAPLAPPSEEEVLRLGEAGYFVRPAFLGRAAALAAAGEVAALAREGRLSPAALGRGAGHRQDAGQRGDLTAWLEDARGGAGAEGGAGGPGLAALRAGFLALGEALNAHAYLGLGRHDVQLALYPGQGARYVRHRDAFAGARGPNRRLTAITYLNPGWEPAHGGLLRLFPEGGPPVDVPPRLDTLVVFLSERLEHEVLPAHAPRLAATAWYYGRSG